MFDTTELLTHLLMIAGWAQTPDGTNALFALICCAALFGLGARLCLIATLLLHLALILL